MAATQLVNAAAAAAAIAAVVAAAAAAAVRFNLVRDGPVLRCGRSYLLMFDPQPPTPEASALSPYPIRVGVTP